MGDSRRHAPSDPGFHPLVHFPPESIRPWALVDSIVTDPDPALLASQNSALVAVTLSSQRRSDLAPYLPPERTHFLPEGKPCDSLDPAQLEAWGTSLKDSIGKIRLPHVTLTYAQSIDGQIALSSSGQTALSGPETKAMTHYLRSQHDAILIGKNTAEVDNPSLNCRFSYDGSHIVDLAHQPKPIILDPSKRWRENMSKKVFYLAKEGLGRGPIWITSQNDPSLSQIRNEATLPEDLSRIGQCEEVGGYGIKAGGFEDPPDGVNWQEILVHLSLNGIRSVMIEGGATVINDLLRDRNQGFIDSVIVTIAPTYLGTGGPVVSPPRTFPDSKEVTLKGVQWLPYGQDVVMVSRLNDHEKYVLRESPHPGDAEAAAPDITGNYLHMYSDGRSFPQNGSGANGSSTANMNSHSGGGMTYGVDGSYGLSDGTLRK